MGLLGWVLAAFAYVAVVVVVMALARAAADADRAIEDAWADMAREPYDSPEDP